MYQLLRHALRAIPLLAFATAIVGAQVRTPEEILTRYTKAVDPDGKVKTLEGFRAVAKMEMPAANMSVTMTTVQRRPDHIMVSMSMPGVGEIKQGFDGTTAWANDPMGGPRLLSEAEAKQLKDGADFRFLARDPALFAKLEPAGETQVNGEATDCVKLTWRSERVTTECYSRASGLLLETRSKNATPQGEIETVTRMHDYKPVGGVLMAHRMVNDMMGMQQTITFTEAEVGPMPASHFELPAEIKALKKP